MKRIVIINGNPKDKSFSAALCESYAKGAETADAKVEIITVRNLDFEHFEAGLGNTASQDIIKVQEMIQAADHLVFIFPIWWYLMPGMLKSFIEQTFSSKFAFNYIKSGKYVKRKPLLTGKTASVIATMDAPPLYYKLIIKDPVGKMMKATMKFCGVKLKKRVYLGSVNFSDENTREKWLEKVKSIGKKFQ